MNRRLKPRTVRSLGLGLLIAAVLIGPGFVSLARLSWRRHVLDHKRRTLDAVHGQLSQERDRLTNDPVYVEGLIRSTFKLAKPGEIVVPLDSNHPSSTRNSSR